MTKYTAVLEVYTLEEILELNDITPEELLIYLIENEVVTLPDIKAVDFDG